jgi:hypothetical protein
MGNGALPNGSSYRAHPRLYHRDTSRQHSTSVAFGAKRTLIKPPLEKADLCSTRPKPKTVGDTVGVTTPARQSNGGYTRVGGLNSSSRSMTSSLHPGPNAHSKRHPIQCRERPMSLRDTRAKLVLSLAMLAATAAGAPITNKSDAPAVARHQLHGAQSVPVRASVRRSVPSARRPDIAGAPLTRSHPRVHEERP